MVLKICGITRVEDALHAAEQGATALGFNLWPKSPRYVTPEQIRAIVSKVPRQVTTVGVFVNAPVDEIRRVVIQAGLSAVQLHGDEPPSHAAALEVPLLRSVAVADVDRTRTEWPAGTTLLVDAIDPVRRGGTGVVVDWTAAAAAARRGPIVLAGGLTPENVSEAIRTVRPFGVDVSSGVESAPGVKDVEKVRAFLERARCAFGAARTAEMHSS
jgi:phosphoribosylanthranilate isomerase